MLSHTLFILPDHSDIRIITQLDRGTKLSKKHCPCIAKSDLDSISLNSQVVFKIAYKLFKGREI